VATDQASEEPDPAACGESGPKELALAGAAARRSPAVRRSSRRPARIGERLDPAGLSGGVLAGE
jgi:hypothetical protein